MWLGAKHRLDYKEIGKRVPLLCPGRGAGEGMKSSNFCEKHFKKL